MNQPTLNLDSHARRSDPSSSHVAVAAIARDAVLREHILHAAARLAPAPFDDTDLHELVEEQTGRRQQRNVIAKSRIFIEREGLFQRIGERNRIDRRTMHFRITTDAERAAFVPTLKMSLREVDQFEWCTTHDRPTIKQCRCRQGVERGQGCNLTALYTKEPS